jgi:hypothetical protein
LSINSFTPRPISYRTLTACTPNCWNPHEGAIQLIEKFSSYNEIKNEIKFLDNPIPTMVAGGAFGLISFNLTFYLLTVFLNPKINS